MQRNLDHKGLFGPGGMTCKDCNACREGMSKRRAKRYAARVTRRRAARAIRSEVTDNA